MNGTFESIAAFIVATGALGTAAFGIVEAFKWTSVGLAGFGQIGKVLGKSLLDALERAYGSQCNELLEAQYREGRGKGKLPRTLRQGVRIGLTEEIAGDVADSLPKLNKEALKRATKIVTDGGSFGESDDEPRDDEARRELARFELAVDARIDAALALAESRYAGTARMVAMSASIAIALLSAVFMLAFAEQPPPPGRTLAIAFLVGVAAVPVAPVAKDIASAFRSANKAIRSVT